MAYRDGGEQVIIGRVRSLSTEPGVQMKGDKIDRDLVSKKNPVPACVVILILTVLVALAVAFGQLPAPWK